MRKIIQQLLIVTIIAPLLVSCAGDNTEPAITIEVGTEKTISIDRFVNEMSIKVKTNAHSWTVHAPGSPWVHFEQEGETLHIRLDENYTVYERIANIHIVAEDESEVIVVKQEKGYPKSLDRFNLYYLEYGSFGNTLTEVDIYEEGLGYLQRYESAEPDLYDLIVKFNAESPEVMERNYCFSENSGNSLVSLVFFYSGVHTKSIVLKDPEQERYFVNPNFIRAIEAADFKMSTELEESYGNFRFDIKSEKRKIAAVILSSLDGSIESINLHPLYN